MIEDKSIIILSGGMDSGVLLAEYKEKLNITNALFFDYGSKHNKKKKDMQFF